MVQRNSAFEPVWIENQSDDEYHANKDHVSSTPVRLISQKSLATFKSEFIDRPETVDSEAFRLGKLFHKLCLEGDDFWDKFQVEPEFGDLRSSKNREAKKEWYDSMPKDAILLTGPELRMIEGQLESLMLHADASAVLKQKGKAEISGYYADPETGILCRIRPDLWVEELGALVDIKTAQDCTFAEFQRSIVKWRYDIQMGMYAEGIRVITGKPIEFAAFVVVEKKKPYEVAVYHPSQEMLDNGKSEYHLSLRKLAQALDTGVWRRYQEKIVEITYPRWFQAS